MKIAIVSGKGGTGKSSITAAIVAQLKGVIAIDCDVDASNLPILFPHKIEQTEPFVSGTSLVIDESVCVSCGLCEQHCSFNALKMIDSKVVVNNVLCEGCGLCVYLCPNDALTLRDEPNSEIYKSRFNHGVLISGRLYPGDDNSGKMIAKLRDIADKEMSRGEIQLQILDGPPGIGCPVISTVTGMDKLLIITEPTQSGISDLSRVYETVHGFCSDIKVVINKCDMNKDAYLTLRKFCSEAGLPIIGEIPFDKQIVEAQVNRETIMTYAPNSLSAMELRKIKEKLILNS